MAHPAHGSQGAAVTALQQLLTAHGHPLTADGEFGGLTAAAVQAFQTEQGLQADGVVGPNTWNALTTTLRTGSQGDAVTALQQLLTARGYSLTADGSFGALPRLPSRPSRGTGGCRPTGSPVRPPGSR